MQPVVCCSALQQLGKHAPEVGPFPPVAQHHDRCATRRGRTTWSHALSWYHCKETYHWSLRPLEAKRVPKPSVPNAPFSFGVFACGSHLGNLGPCEAALMQLLCAALRQSHCKQTELGDGGEGRRKRCWRVRSQELSSVMPIYSSAIQEVMRAISPGELWSKSPNGKQAFRPEAARLSRLLRPVAPATLL
jgi:hypothetical protein